MFEPEMQMDAKISKDGQYRYWLSRTWGDSGKVIAFIGLNPSTADATQDDPTIRRCINFAKSWGGTSLLMVNLFAYRSTDPSNLRSAIDPIGQENDIWLARAVQDATIVVAAWGNNGTYLDRSEKVRRMFAGKLKALKITKLGMPSHPLYVPANTLPCSFT